MIGFFLMKKNQGRIFNLKFNAKIAMHTITLSPIVYNGDTRVQIGEGLLRFALHLLPMVLPTTKNGLQPKP